MRGRVNTDLYSGISLNANTDQFEVSGGNVVAGDFVQYKYAGAERKQLSTSRLTVYVKYYKVTNDLYITNEGTLYDVSSGNMIQVAAAEYTGKFIDHISDYKYLLGCTGITLVIEVDIINKTIVTLSSVEHLWPFENVIALGIVGTNRNRAIRWSSSQAPYTTAYGNRYQNNFSILDISDLNNISIIQNYQQDRQTDEKVVPAFISVFLGTTENKFFFYSYLATSSSSYVRRHGYIEFDESTDYFVLNSLEVPIATIWATSDYFESSLKVNYCQNNIFNNRFSVSISDNDVSNAYIIVHDLNSKTTKGTRLFQSEMVVRTTTYSTGNETRGICISEVDDNGEFYIVSAPFNSNVDNGIGVCKCRITSDGQIEIIRTLVTFIPNNTVPYSVIAPLNMGDKVMIILMPTSTGTTEGNGTYYYNAEVVNGDIVIGEQTDKVEPYDGTNPKMLLGVAAQSGSSGDTINVYVPLANT